MMKIAAGEGRRWDSVGEFMSRSYGRGTLIESVE